MPPDHEALKDHAAEVPEKKRALKFHKKFAEHSLPHHHLSLCISDTHAGGPR